jgi:hypothetical protein
MSYGNPSLESDVDGKECRVVEGELEGANFLILGLYFVCIR